LPAILKEMLSSHVERDAPFIDKVKASINIGISALTGSLTNELSKRPIILQEFLNTYGDYTVTKAVIMRAPVMPVIEWILKTQLSFRPIAEQLKYDRIFHLSINLYLNNGMKVMFEKNERISINTEGRDENQKDMETFLIDRIPPLLSDGTPATKSITLVTAINKAEQLYGLTRMYYYNGATTNCQRFVLDLLSVFGVEDNELMRAFVLQDASSLLNKYMAKISLLITDMFGIANYVQRGGKADEQDKEQDKEQDTFRRGRQMATLQRDRWRDDRRDDRRDRWRGDRRGRHY
jgi:hypothetical protein